MSSAYPNAQALTEMASQAWAFKALFLKNIKAVHLQQTMANEPLEIGFHINKLPFKRNSTNFRYNDPVNKDSPALS